MSATRVSWVSKGMYYKGAAPVRIENLLSEAPICFQQTGNMQVSKLAPGKSTLYTWEFPDKKRELRWWVEGDDKNWKKADFIKDNSITFSYTYLVPTVRKAQLVSFLDGLQRVLLFTDDVAISDCVGKEVIKIEQSHMLFEVNLPEPIGISLVDGVPQEIAYIQLDSSGPIWERKLKNKDRYKYLPSKVSDALEKCYNSDKLEEQFEGYTFNMAKKYEDLMFLTQSDGRTYQIRRSYLSALWLHYDSSATQSNIHFKINRIQIDNQLQDFTYRHVYYPIKPPAHAIAEQPPKPLIEFCMVKQTTAVDGDRDNSVLDHYKYVKLLIQEFHVQLDADFLLSMMNFLKIDEVRYVCELSNVNGCFVGEFITAVCNICGSNI
eukprot:sb/3465709/